MDKLGGRASHTARVVIAIFAVAVIARLVFALWVAPHIPQLDQQVASDQGLRISRNLVAGQGYKMTFAGLEYYSFRPPTFPLFLAGVIWLFGDGFTVIALAMSALGGLTAVLIYFLAGELYRPPVPLMAGAVSCLYPTFIYVAGWPISENLAIPLLVALILCLMRLYHTKRRRYVVLAGVLLGLMVLCRTLYLPFAAIIAAWIFYVYEDRRQAVGHIAALAAIVVAMFVPWVARNYNVHHRFIPTSTDGGLVLYFSNSPAMLQGTAGADMHEYNSHIEELRQMDEIERDRWFYREGFKSIRENTGLYARRVAARMWRLWKPFPNVDGWRAKDVARAALMLATYTPLFILFVAGVWVSRERRKELWLLLALFIYLTVVSSLIHSVLRYRAALEPFILIVGMAGLYHFVQKLRARGQTEALAGRQEKIISSGA
jgi:4-amino-4-deoxy-L-arabinose transferase-like glycosyltransferase